MDLTKITTPFGLLDEETQNALIEHAGPFEFYDEDGDWTGISIPSWRPDVVYRVKPQPPKPREWWMVIGTTGSITGYWTYLEAEQDLEAQVGNLIRVREVLE